MPRTELFLGNLGRDISRSDIEKNFDKYGHLVRCDLKNRGRFNTDQLLLVNPIGLNLYLFIFKVLVQTLHFWNSKTNVMLRYCISILKFISLTDIFSLKF